jgi:hypothetical protein
VDVIGVPMPGVWAALLVAAAVWACVGAVRDYKGTKEAARAAYEATRQGLRADRGEAVSVSVSLGAAPGAAPSAPEGAVRPRDVLKEMLVGGVACAAAAGAALGWAAGHDVYRAVKKRRAAKAIPAGAVPDAPDASDSSAAAGEGARPPGWSDGPPGSAAGEAGASRGYRSRYAGFGFGRGRPAAAEYVEGELADEEPTRARHPDFDGVVVDAEFAEAFVLDPAAPPPARDPQYPASPSPKETPVSEIANTIPGALAPSATFNQAKTDLRDAREALSALASALSTQVSIGAARSQTADSRADELETLAIQARALAAKTRASAEYAQGNRVDAASVAALGEVAGQADTLASRAETAAEIAHTLAETERQLTEALSSMQSASADVASAADNAHATISRHQDPHQQAVSATGHEGATAEYLVG